MLKGWIHTCCNVLYNLKIKRVFFPLFFSFFFQKFCFWILLRFTLSVRISLKQSFLQKHYVSSFHNVAVVQVMTVRISLEQSLPQKHYGSSLHNESLQLSSLCLSYAPWKQPFHCLLNKICAKSAISTFPKMFHNHPYVTVFSTVQQNYKLVIADANQFKWDKNHTQ